MKKNFALVIILSSGLGVLIEMIMTSLDTSILNGVKLLRYFTIQSNLLVCIFFVLILMGLDQKYKNYLGGVTIYIFVTFTIYFTMLSMIWNPTGLRALSNALLHYITPWLVVIYSIYTRSEYKYQKSDILKWMIYPLGYLLFLFLHGAITNDYIYPFFNVVENGVFSVILMVVFLVVFFVILSFLLMKIVSLKKLKI